MIITSDFNGCVSSVDANVIAALTHVFSGIVKRDVAYKQLGASGHQFTHQDPALFLQVYNVGTVNEIRTTASVTRNLRNL
jgi:hypothetical protein